MIRYPPFEGSAAPADRVPVDAVVALGANLGDRAATLAAAVDDMERMPLTDAVRVSSPVETVAMTATGEDAAAPRYLNAVALVTTRLAPEVLLGYLHAIEERHGRVRATDRDIRAHGSGDRTLDLDLVAYGDLVVDGPPLTLPHPRAAERDFVLGPWLSLDPDAVLVGRGRAAGLLAALDGRDAAGSVADSAGDGREPSGSVTDSAESARTAASAPGPSGASS